MTHTQILRELRGVATFFAKPEVRIHLEQKYGKILVTVPIDY